MLYYAILITDQISATAHKENVMSNGIDRKKAEMVVKAMEEKTRQKRHNHPEYSYAITTAAVQLVTGYSISVHVSMRKRLRYVYGHQSVSRKTMIDRLSEVGKSIHVHA
jgi:hypothetical protein